MSVSLKSLHDLLRIVFLADILHAGEIGATVSGQRVLVKSRIADESKLELDAHSRCNFFHGSAAGVYGFVGKLIVLIFCPLDDRGVP